MREVCLPDLESGQGFPEDDMPNSLDLLREQANWTRFRAGQTAGHYESFFQRANHPSRPLAFWIRYTLFSPRGQPQQAVGELWAIVFNGETGRQTVVRQALPMARCHFDPARFNIQIGDAHLGPGQLLGSAAGADHTIAWDLAFAGDAAPLFLLPAELYAAGFPKAKSLVALPMACYNGTIAVDGQLIQIENWIGSQNHNWGSQHTDDYAWGQVAGFDTHPDSFLEVASARLRLGPLWAPPLTPLVLRHEGREIALNSLRQTLRAHSSRHDFVWRFRSETGGLCVEGVISAPREDFVALRYDNPPGGSKLCLNSKLAACKLTVTDRQAGRGAAPQTLACRQRAAFEILTDDRPPSDVRLEAGHAL